MSQTIHFGYFNFNFLSKAGMGGTSGGAGRLGAPGRREAQRGKS
jgi:hypothetical protein